MALSSLSPLTLRPLTNQSAAAAELMGGLYTPPQTAPLPDPNPPTMPEIVGDMSDIWRQIAGGETNDAKQAASDAETPPAAPPVSPAPAPTLVPAATPDVGSDAWYRAQDARSPTGWEYNGTTGTTAAKSPASSTGSSTGNTAYVFQSPSSFNPNLAMSLQNANNLNPLLTGDAMARIQEAISRLSGSGNYNLNSLVRQLGGFR